MNLAQRIFIFHRENILPALYKYEENKINIEIGMATKEKYWEVSWDIEAELDDKFDFVSQLGVTNPTRSS